MKRINTEEFINRAESTHNKRYDYSLVDYRNMNERVVIICKEHGKFLQYPNCHLKGSGCKKCSNIYNSRRLTNNTSKFIQKAKNIHADKYIYEKVDYKNNKSNVTIICPIHGEFQQTPANHISGKGCSKCGVKRIKGGWKYNDWKSRSKSSKNFESFKLYIIKCWNETEEFYKIGRTYNNLNRRFLGKKRMPYNYNILKIVEFKDPNLICKLEQDLHKLNKEYKYTPSLKFGGYTECYNKLQNEDTINDLIDKFGG